MSARLPISCRTAERGVALLIAVFALLLISGVAISLIVMAGTESAINANYRGSTQAFYAGQAGLEEVRGRLAPNHPNAFANMTPPFVVAPGAILPVGQVRYVRNSSAGEVVDPTNLSPDNPYRDVEYQQEFGVPVTSATVQMTNSVSPVAGLPGPLFKWVRITAKTERSSGIDVNGDGVLDATTPLFYDGQNQNLLSQGFQVFSVTSLAVLPNGSQRALHYDVATRGFNVSFPAAMTLDGSGATYGTTHSNVFYMNGNDRQGTNALSCGLPLGPPRPAIGTVSDADATIVANSVFRPDHYLGSGPTPSVVNVSPQMPPNLLSPSALDGPNGLLQLLLNNADQVVQGPATSLPNYGSPTQPLITFVQGDLSLTSVTGYGILVVTGNFTASGNTGWRGIVLVVGQGTMTVNGGGNNSYNGAVLVARTRDAAGNLLATLGPPVLNWNGGGGNGVYYDSCWINNAQSGAVYQVLSFREITQ